MKVVAVDGAGRSVFLFPVFYDVPLNSLALITFVETAQSFQKLVESFNQELFEGQVQYRIYVLPPETGSFGQRFGVTIIAGASFVAGALVAPSIGEFGKGFVEGVIGQPLREWGQEVGGNAIEALERWKVESGGEAGREEAGERQDMERDHAVACGAFTSLSQHFLAKSNDQLRDHGVVPQDFPNAFEAKNEFFEACEVNPQVSSLRFGDIPDLVIPREEFQRRQSLIAREEDEEWKFENVKLFVTSPNWDRQDRQRGWKARDSRGSVVFFQIADNYFWRRFDDGRINSKNIDEVVGQVAYRKEAGRKKSRVMLNVVAYNDELYMST